MPKSPVAKRFDAGANRPRRVEFYCDIYFAEIHAGVVDYARTAGWALYDGKCYDVESPYTEPSDGILTVVARPRLLKWLQAQNCPVV